LYDNFSRLLVNAKTGVKHNLSQLSFNIPITAIHQTTYTVFAVRPKPPKPNQTTEFLEHTNFIW